MFWGLLLNYLVFKMKNNHFPCAEMRVLQGFWGREHEPVLGNTGTTKINVAFDDGEGGKQRKHENTGELWRGTKEQGPPNRRDPVITIYSAIACY